MLSHLAQRQREAKDTYERVENLEYKIDSIAHQQTLWLKSLSKSDSDFKLTNFADLKGISKAATISQESAIYDCNEEANEDGSEVDRTEADRRSHVGVLHDIPEEDKLVATEPMLQRQRAACDNDYSDTDDVTVEVNREDGYNCDVVDERL